MPRIGAQFRDRLAFASRPALTALALLALLAAMMLARSAHAQLPLDANTAASLPEPDPVANDDRAGQPDASAQAKPVPIPAALMPPPGRLTAPPATATGAVTATATTMVLPAPAQSLESRSIGRPAGASGARTKADDRAARVESGEGTSGALGGLDPRSNEFTRVLGALAAVVGLILLTRTLVVRYMPWLFAGGAGRPDRPSGVIEVLARYPIGRGQQLLVLKFARRILLVHQAGSTSRTLTEMTDPDEVAATLSRLEAGASVRSAGKFKAALQAFESEHEAASARRSRSGAALAATETEIIDLTRTQIRNIGHIPGMRRALR